MIEKVIKIDVDELKALGGLDNLKNKLEQTEQSSKNLRTQIKEATQELVSAKDRFGDYSNEALKAAKSLAILKDKMQDAQEVTALFDPGAKFQAATGAIAAGANALTVYTAGMQMMGVESESVEKALLKVNSAMAFSQGLSALADSAKDFKRLEAVAVAAFKNISKAMLTTGIGALVVVVGTLVAYWDEINEFIQGASNKTVKLTEISLRQYEVEQSKSKELGNQDNILKLQGKSEKEILDIKIRQKENEINAGKIAINRLRIEREESIKNAKERNATLVNGLNLAFKFVKSGLALVSTPIDLLMKTINLISEKLGKGKVFTKDLSGYVGDLNQYAADSIFNVAATSEDYDKKINDLQKGVSTTQNDWAGLKLQQRGDGGSRSGGGSMSGGDSKTTEEVDYERLEAIKGKEIELNLAGLEHDKLMNSEKEALMFQHLESVQYAVDREIELDEMLKASKKDMLNNLAYIFGEESKMGQAMLIAKEAMKARELIMDIQENITFATMEGAKAGVAISSGAAQTAKIGFPQNVPMLIAYAAQGAMIIRNVMNAIKRIKGAGSASSSVGTPNVQTAPAAPQFNMVGDTGVNQIAKTLANQEPVKAYVVAKEVTTQQALDRNIQTKASF